MSPEEFEKSTKTIFSYIYYPSYLVTSVLSVTALAFVLLKKRQTTILVLLYLAVFFDAANFVSLEFFDSYDKDRPLFMASLCANTSLDELAHLIVCYCYLKVIIDLNALMDKSIHLDNRQKLNQTALQKRQLFIAALIFATICTLDGLYCMVGFMIKSEKQILISQYLVVALDFVFLAFWGLSLILLNRKVKQAKELIPNRLIFCLHGSVLVCFIISNAIYLIVLTLQIKATGNRLMILQGIANIAGSSLAFFECAGFLLVFALVTPITQAQEKRQADFKAFLLNGSAGTEALLDSILAENPHMTEEEVAELTESFERYGEFYKGTILSQRVVSEMCSVDKQSIVFKGYEGFRYKRKPKMSHCSTNYNKSSSSSSDEESRKSTVSYILTDCPLLASADSNYSSKQSFNRV